LEICNRRPVTCSFLKQIYDDADSSSCCFGALILLSSEQDLLKFERLTTIFLISLYFVHEFPLLSLHSAIYKTDLFKKKDKVKKVLFTNFFDSFVGYRFFYSVRHYVWMCNIQTSQIGNMNTIRSVLQDL